ncbi:MAG: D-glycero-beta-D-manno-heptose 1,7-bisphosphate 7-phosphatase [Campylobacteraceae bacterium]|nr:D-glycero-beta-D-manno-heptose 1,7-bisphosphate 7-phosphatase [Campylobacteraceae bacterium]
MKKAVFLDRDGVINIDKGYVSKVEDFTFIEGVMQTLRELKNAGFLLFIVTNQSGIGRGYYSEDDYLMLTRWMIEKFKENEISIAKIYHCSHSPEENCDCRKPKPAMLLKAIEEFGVNPKVSWMVGDKKSDIDAAKNAGVENCIYIGDEKIDFVYNHRSLKDAKNRILGEKQ